MVKMVLLIIWSLLLTRCQQMQIDARDLPDCIERTHR